MNAHALSRGLEILRVTHRVPPELVSRLSRYIAEAPDEALYRLAPLRLAAELELSEKQALDLLVYATHAGLFEFAWGIVCPACTGFIQTPAALRAIEQSHNCGMCRIEVPLDDDSLEVAFTVTPGVRSIRFHAHDSLDFMVDGGRLMFSPSSGALPAAPELAAELTLWWGRVERGGTVEIPAELPAGEYLLLVPALHAFAQVRAVENGPTSAEVSLVEAGLFPSGLELASDRPVTIKVRNQGEAVIVALGRRPQYEPFSESLMVPYVTGKRLFTTHAFRELFRAESIPSPTGLSLKRLTVVFTDLKGSTALYDRIGDFRAWELVRAHFDLLRETIDAHGGAMVKTIGDAIMATFAEPLPAFEAAARMSRDIRNVGDGALELKVGLHSGPCIAVELNQQLDYFGQTVNVASRVQGLADGGEIVCTQSVWETPGVRELAREARLEAVADRAQLRGVAEEMALQRLRATVALETTR